MNLFILSQYKLIRDLYKNADYMDLLINIDDFFDILNLYAFPNWLDAEVVDVKCMKYFTSISIKTPYKTMPHPKGAVLLTKYDCQVKYKETTEMVTKEVNGIEDTYIDRRTGDRKPKVEKRKCWIVDILIPNKHIINDQVYDLQSVQEKLDKEEKSNESMENVVTNEEDRGDLNNTNL